MIEICLPFVYNNELFYDNLKQASNNHEFFNEIFFSSQYGNFPWSYWHGGKSTNVDPEKTVVLEKDISKFANSYKHPIYFDIANVNLNEKDLYDRKLNMILTKLNHGANKIIVSSFSIYNQLVKKFPYYDYIFSENACLERPFTPEIINTINSQNIFHSIILNPNLVDQEFDYKAIEEKNKIYIKLNLSCPKECEKIKDCMLQEQGMQYNFSEFSVFKQCNKTKTLEELSANLQSEIEYYHNLGFTRFMLDEPSKNFNLNQYKISLLSGLFKNKNNILLRGI